MSAITINPRHFFSNGSPGREKLNKALREGEPVILFIDFDGTLVPIRKNRELAYPSKFSMRVMEELIRSRAVIPVVVTGRSLDDIHRRIPLSGLCCAANHGFQIQKPNLFWVHPAAKNAGKILRRTAAALRKIFKNASRIGVEDKGCTISVHYRNAKPSLEPWVVKTIAEGLRASSLKSTRGKKVIEIRPNVKWNKGEAVLKFLKNFSPGKKSLSVYLGDDETDEDAFKVLRDKGITIRVGGGKPTRARYYLKNSGEVNAFLRWCLRRAG